HSVIGFKTAAGAFNIQGLYDNQYAYRELETTYNPERVPDAIILHVGMNDSATDLTSGVFVETAKEFIDTLRNDYYGGRKVPVVWLYNTMFHAGRTGEIKALIQYMGGEAESRVYAVELNYGTSGSGLSATSRYPSAEEHQKSVDILVPYLKNLLKLK
ncbi:MAG: hypothetical protein IKU24_03590, partial [Clostridia bacterium]|nr:hypothetical protein [Clostridia bacterium]